MWTTSQAEQPPVPISTSSIGLGPGFLTSSPCAVPNASLCPLSVSPTKVRASTHLTRAFIGRGYSSSSVGLALSWPQFSSPMRLTRSIWVSR